jgi:branched-chain amino acid transport system ATP-binding protein
VTGVLIIKNLTVRYDKIEALSGVCMENNEGEMISVIGRNGSGKSTLLRAISGLMPVAEGEIIFWGQRIDNMPAPRIVKLGITHVPEGRRIFARMNVRENLQLGATVVKEKKKREEAFEFVFKLFPRLKERLKQSAGTLSGGEQQMLAIGRSLMSKPKLLLADEVSMGLAPIVTTLICEKLKEVSQIENVSVILVEQNAKIALYITERSYLIDGGRILLSGNAKEMADNADVKKIYLGVD